MRAFIRHDPPGPALPLVLDSPHSGTEYPQDFGHSVPRDQLRPTVDGVIAELGGCGPLSVACAKSAIERGHGRPLEEGLAIERESYEVTLYSEDRDEGLAAFAEGRPPKYQGR